MDGGCGSSIPQHNFTASVKRLRKYLTGTPDEPGGALHYLTSLGAFDICIRDEEEFWAAGRHWKKKFWESMLVVKIPNLAIRKTKNGVNKKIQRRIIGEA